MLNISNTTSRQKTIFVNTASQMIGRFISTGTTFVISLFLIGRFGVDVYGDFIKITAYAAPFYLLADFGINAVYLQFSHSKSKENEADAWYTLLILRVIISLLLIIVAVGILNLLPAGQTSGYTNEVRLGIILFIPSIVLQAVITSSNASFQKNLTYIYAAKAIFVGSVITTAVIVFIVLSIPTRHPAIAGSTAVALGLACTAAISVYSVSKIIRLKHFIFIKKIAWMLFKKSIPLGITLVFNLIYFRLDHYILTIYRPTWEVGIYGFIYKIFEAAIVFPAFFMNSLFPILITNKSNLYSFSSLINKTLAKTFLILIGLALTVMGTILLLSNLLTFVQSEFIYGVLPLQILSIGIPFFYLSSLTMWLLILFEKRWLLAAIYGFSLILNIILNINYIPSFGLTAAAAITVICEAVVLILSAIIVTHHLAVKKMLS